MRLSPKSVFFALVVLGLPFAVVAGWALGAPVARQAGLGAPDGPGAILGDGGLGAAPGGAAPTRDSAAGYTARPPRGTPDPVPSLSAPAAGPATVIATVTVVQSVPVPPVETTDPPLTAPPVPTPTQPDPPPSPSATPSSPSASATPSASTPVAMGF
ncbi:hypothetical protein Aca07nite_05600 [Actinoplanes capillaceus]|uniref:Uncharacterized protein n=1 Tax=Actinoplanes campanulatus TaxID=113559 RepID=A0ABQ3WBR3_9ACTN|nr:hypothetical protein Aca07nite_05600 [Actinoplanes capillaceus]